MAQFSATLVVPSADQITSTIAESDVGVDLALVFYPSSLKLIAPPGRPLRSIVTPVLLEFEFVRSTVIWAEGSSGVSSHWETDWVSPFGAPQPATSNPTISRLVKNRIVMVRAFLRDNRCSSEMKKR